MTFDEFKAHYERFGWTPGDISRREKPLNDNQLLTKYQRYQKKQERRTQALEVSQAESKEITLDQEVRLAVETQDRNRCRLNDLLVRIGDTDRLSTLRSRAGALLLVLDAAHVFGKGSHPWMRYRISNVILLNRYSHSMLDTGHDPITGKALRAEEIKGWWELLVGEATYKSLEEDANNRRKAWHEITS